jgi:hypothetical protein
VVWDEFNSFYVIEYEKFITNCLDRRALSSFLELPICLLLNVDYCKKNNSEADVIKLIESEKDVIRSTLDLTLLAEARKIILQQFSHHAKRRFSSVHPKVQVCHTEGKRLANIYYCEFQIDGCPYIFRGRRVGVLVQNSYALRIGNATTFGRFFDTPYAEKLQAELKFLVVNFGIGGARPETFPA